MWKNKSNWNLNQKPQNVFLKIKVKNVKDN